VPKADLAFESVPQIKKSAQPVTIEGISSTRIDDVDKEGDSTTLTLLGYNYQGMPASPTTSSPSESEHGG